MSGLFALWLFAAPATPTPTPATMSLDGHAPAVVTPTPTPTPAPASTPASLDAPLPTTTPAPAAAPAPKRIAVVVVGDDAGASGDLQRDLEKRLPLAVPGMVIRTAADVANRAGVATAAAAAPELDPATAALLEQAIGAYYDAQYVKALDLFAKVQGLYENTSAPASKRTEVFLWRVAVFLGLNDAVQAQTEALAALSLNPELKVDAKSEIPPSVQEQLNRARTSAGFRLVTVIVNGLPATASLSVDGRSVPSRFKVTPGKHTIVASSSARRTVTREIDVTADTAVSISLPIALAPEDHAAVTAFVTGADETPAIAGLAAKLDTDWVLLAVVGAAETRAALRRSPTGVVYRTKPARANEAPPTLIEFFQPRLVRSLDEKAPPGPGVARDGWVIRADGTLVASGWSRSVSGGETFETFFGGAGPEVRVEATKDALLVTGAASWVSYDGSSVDVRLPDGSRTKATGGSTSRLLVGGGWRGFGPERELVRGVLALDVESHASKDPANRGAKLNLLTPYTRAALELRGGTRFAAPGLPAWRLDLELGLSPYAYFAESPSGASGDSPASGLGYLWSAGLESGGASRWGTRLAYSGDMRSVRFKGTSDAAVSPPMSNAELREMYHALSLTLTRRF